MQTQANTSGSKSTSQSFEQSGFDQMAKSLSTAIADFDDSGSTFASVAKSLRPAWQATTRYVRRHPVQIAVGAAAIGVCTVLLLRPRATTVRSDSNDGRQY